MNPSRSSPLPNRITTYLAENPGAPLYKIVEAVGASRGAVTYQIRTLTAKRIIKVHEETGTRRYYLYNFSYTQDTELLHSLLENKTKSDVLAVLKKSPGQTRKEIAKEIGIPENTLYRHIAALVNAGILRRERDGHSWRYMVSKKYPAGTLQNLSGK